MSKANAQVSLHIMYTMWDDLIRHCKAKALELGQEMQDHFVDSDIAKFLWESSRCHHRDRAEQNHDPPLCN